MTLVARPIPPTPPQSTDGHPLPEESFQGPGTYRAVCINMQMSGEISGQEIVSLIFWLLPHSNANHLSTTGLLRSTPSPVILTCLLNR